MCGGQGLFEQKYIVHIKDVCEDETGQEILFSFLKEIWNLIMVCYRFFKQKNDSTLKGFVKVLIFILRILIILFFLLFILVVIVLLAQLLSYIIRLNNGLFKTLNDMFSTIEPVDTIGSTIRKIFENC
jgi:hypothetical protein